MVCKRKATQPSLHGLLANPNHHTCAATPRPPQPAAAPPPGHPGHAGHPAPRPPRPRPPRPPGHPATRPRTKRIYPPKVVWEWCALHLLTWKCALRHNGVHFFDISTSKRAPKLRCFVHFDLDMCFAPHGLPFFISRLASWLLVDPPESQTIGRTQ